MMIKTRYFNLMKVYDVTGKYLGSVQDIAIDFYSGMVTGVIINSFSINKKKNYIAISDVKFLNHKVADTEKDVFGIKEHIKLIK